MSDATVIEEQVRERVQNDCHQRVHRAFMGLRSALASAGIDIHHPTGSKTVDRRLDEIQRELVERRTNELLPVAMNNLINKVSIAQLLGDAYGPSTDKAA